MAELALWVDSLPKKGNLSSTCQHVTSCQWFDWQRQNKNHFCEEPSLVVGRSKRYNENATYPPRFGKRLDRLENRREASAGGIKRIVPNGEAQDKNVFTFSMHDNRHQIKAPEKKTVLCSSDRQSQSSNINNTLSWSRNMKDTEYVVTKTSQDREILRTDTHLPPQRPMFRRFPKNHHREIPKGMDRRRSQQNLLAQEGIPCPDKNISLPILAQPQSYINFQAELPKKPNARRAKTSPGWCYSYHGKTFSKRVSNATQHACYRF